MLKKLILVGSLMALHACKESHEHPLPDPIFIDRPTEPIPPAREPPRPGFQTVDTNEDSILLDLQNLDSDTQRRNTRYVIGCDRLNLGNQMAEFEQGVDRGFNQLSSERELYKSVAIGPGNCIYRIDLEEIGWTRSDWEVLSKNDILFFESKTIRNRNIQFLTQAKRPYVYASSALITAFEGDAVANKGGAVYYTLVNQAIGTVQFFDQQGVNRQAQVNDEEAMFSGFSQSQIALGKTRLIAVFESQNGACISTYDTVLGGDDIFKNPFSLELSRAGQVNNQQVSQKIFGHNAQEHICTLPNGLFGLYRLNNAQDVAEVAAPNNIVINVDGARIDPTIRIGDCSNCHFKQGVAIPFRDQLRAHIASNTAFDQNEKRLGQIFFRFDKITARIEQLNKEHTRAMDVLGITASEDPLWNVVAKPLREEMTLDQVAALLFMDSATFKDRLRGAAASSQVFGNLLSGGTINLAVLSANFTNLVEELGAFEDEDL